MQPILPLGNNIWTIPAPLKLAGVPFGTKTTVVKLSNGELWLHAPGPLEADAVAGIQELGPVAYLIAPNLFHHVYLAEAQEFFPEAQTFIASGLSEKVKNIQFQEILTGSHKKLWDDDLDFVFVGGMPKVNETIFLHRPSGTLIITDMMFNFGRGNSLWERFFLRIIGAHEHLGPSRLDRIMMKNKTMVKESIDQILAWDFERIVMCHGQTVEQHAKRRFYEAFAFLG